jgi:hypothetical protein
MRLREFTILKEDDAALRRELDSLKALKLISNTDRYDDRIAELETQLGVNDNDGSSNDQQLSGQTNSVGLPVEIDAEIDGLPNSVLPIQAWQGKTPQNAYRLVRNYVETDNLNNSQMVYIVQRWVNKSQKRFSQWYDEMKDALGEARQEDDFEENYREWQNCITWIYLMNAILRRHPDYNGAGTSPTSYGSGASSRISSEMKRDFFRALGFEPDDGGS